MRILIDGDGSPVIDITIRIAKAHGTQCYILCDSAHHFDRDGATTITISKGKDNTDLALANMIHTGDVAVTGDYGLAALCLARGATPISQDGMIYTDDNIGGLLEQRHMAQQIRRAGGRLSGPAKRTEEQNAAFAAALSRLLSE